VQTNVSRLPPRPAISAIFSQEEKAEILGFVMSLHRTRAAWFEKASRVMARHGFSTAEFDVLSTLERASRKDYTLTPKELQASLLITSGGLTKVLRQLEERGLVTRSLEAVDRRVKPVKIVPNAILTIRAAREEVFTVVGTWLHDALEREQIAQATALLQRLGGFEPVPHYPEGI
jgi:DNA-binding MarR family transcriptional regulator